MVFSHWLGHYKFPVWELHLAPKVLNQIAIYSIQL